MWESRVAPLSGVLFALLLIAGFVVDPNTEFMPPEGDIVAHLQEGPVRVMTAAYLGLLAAVALVWFSGTIYKSIRRIDDDGGRLSALALAGGVFASALLAVGGVATIAAAERVWVTGVIEPGAAASLLDIAGIAIGNGAPVGLAVLIGASAIASLRTEGPYRWTGWASLLIALGLVSPYGWVVLAVAVLWVLAAAIWMYRAESPTMSVEVA